MSTAEPRRSQEDTSGPARSSKPVICGKRMTAMESENGSEKEYSTSSVGASRKCVTSVGEPPGAVSTIFHRPATAVLELNVQGVGTALLEVVLVELPGRRELLVVLSDHSLAQ